MSLRLFLTSLLVVSPLLAQQTDPVSARAQADLDKTLQELESTRKTIAVAKVPLLAELNQLEARVKEVGSQYESSQRLLETRNLEATNISNEAKAKENEVTYLTNILAEYVVGLKTTVHQSELPSLGPLIEAADNAAKNETLSPSVRFEKQLAALDASLTRAEQVVGGYTFDGEATGADGTVHKGKFALLGPTAFFASTSGAIVGIAKAESGTGSNLKPFIAPLEPASLNPGIASTVNTGSGEVPVDVTNGSALQQLLNRSSLWTYYKQGGPIMHPIALLAILAVGTLLERMIFTMREKMRTRKKARTRIFEALESGDLARATTVSADSKDYIARMLTYALVHRGKSLSDALQHASGQALAPYHRGIVIMETVVTLAPLLGLLGTVTGMMGSFGMLGGGEISGTTAITGGIAEALIATAAGLGIAIITVLPMNWLVARQEHARHEIEDACTHCELLAKPLIDVEKKLAELPAASVPETKPSNA